MENSRCVAWLSRVWTQLTGPSPTRGDGGFESLPDEVVTDILSRLQADQVVKLRSVCRRWCALTAAPNFAQRHLEKAAPLIVFQAFYWTYHRRDGFHLFYVDTCSKRKKKLIGKISSTRILHMSSTTQRHLKLCGSCNGLLIFQRGTPDKYDFEKVAPFTYYICNPIIQELITVRAGGKVFGFFFHSLANEYQLLRFNQSSDDQFRFGIGSLGPMMWREVGPFPYRPRELNAPPVVNGCLHWMAIGPCSHSIMLFRIEDGEFRFMPHPGKLNQSCEGHENMHLLSSKGRLYAYRTYAKVLGIWVLEDAASWRWVKKFNVHLERDLKQFPRSYQGFFETKLWDVWNDQLLLMLPGKGLLRYQRQSKRIMKVQSGRLKKGFKMISAEYTGSLVSLSGYCER
ncbi:F-box protein At3g07870-like [Rhodamnia argentea]|uniref:F-box protein At3g07870-like n=1 Tax=Rhodamnia argentea TaxID=178133 RepID=A0A8B8PEN1_9MYRT|nr:F-box protein At3g07870-like [Rhodamnia argentea]